MKQEIKQKFALGGFIRKFRVRIYIFVAVIAVIGIYVYFWNAPVAPGKYDNFAKCIKDSGAIFYGAFWCPHCRNQKEMFGNSARLLPYVECSLPDSSGQTAVCVEKGIQSYPTWVFKDGSQLSGEIPLATLSEKTGCALPPQ